MNFSKWTVRARLFFGFGLVLTLLLVVAVVGIRGMTAAQEKLDGIVNENGKKQGLATAMRVTVLDRMIASRNLVFITDPSEMTPEVERMARNAEKYADAERGLQKMLSELASTTPEENAMLQRVKDAEAPAVLAMRKAQELATANKNEAATTVLLKEARPLQQKWLALLTELIEKQVKLSEEAFAAATESAKAARNIMLTLVITAIMLGVAAAFLITRSLLSQLGGEPSYAAEIASRVAAGDLVSPVSVQPGDTTSMLARMKAMQESLGQIVGGVRAATETIGTASAQIATGNADLSQRTEEQASNLEETASSMEELTSTVKQNADNARQASQLAASASTVAEKGGSAVRDVVTTMTAISESSRKITDIIGVIDGIAFQTNILALNAAVEAARAGEQGRGFAVVAGEVRNLAQRSAAAAKEIKSLIEDSVGKVDSGSKLVETAGATMHEVVASIRRVTDIMSEITAASQEQSSGIEQVNQAVMQMDQVTQQNAALVEEAAAAAESMQEQARSLAQSVAVFKVAASATTAAVAPAVTEKRTVERRGPGRATNVARLAPRKKAAETAVDAPAANVPRAKTGTSDEWTEF